MPERLHDLAWPYWVDVEAKWRRFAIVGRYGHQSIPSVLGRQLTDLEIGLFTRAVGDLLEVEYKPPAGPGPGQD